MDHVLQRQEDKIRNSWLVVTGSILNLTGENDWRGEATAHHGHGATKKSYKVMFQSIGRSPGIKTELPPHNHREIPPTNQADAK